MEILKRFSLIFAAALISGFFISQTECVAVQPQFTLTGKVTDAATNAPIFQALVEVAPTIISPGSTVQRKTALTDGAGTYSIAGFLANTPADQSITVSKCGYVTQTRRMTNSVENFALAVPRYSVSGRILDKVGSGINGAVVSINTSPVQSVNNSSNGDYSFTGILPGTYTVSASYTGLNPATQTVTVSNGNVSWVNLTLRPLTYTVTGKVTSETANGAALGNILVVFGNSSYRVSTPDDGNYTLSNVETGGYNLSAQGRWFQDFYEIQFQVNGNTTKNIFMKPIVLDKLSLRVGCCTSTIIGSCRFLCGATVTLASLVGTPVGDNTTNNTCHYEWTNIKEGSYTLSVGSKQKPTPYMVNGAQDIIMMDENCTQFQVP